MSVVELLAPREVDRWTRRRLAEGAHQAAKSAGDKDAVASFAADLRSIEREGQKDARARLASLSQGHQPDFVGQENGSNGTRAGTSLLSLSLGELRENSRENSGGVPREKRLQLRAAGEESSSEEGEGEGAGEEEEEGGVAGRCMDLLGPIGAPTLQDRQKRIDRSRTILRKEAKLQKDLFNHQPTQTLDAEAEIEF
ncbi:hypothetical protein T484DRAFT_1894545, partial [Baffinella frigidus]